ncbi:MAG: surface-adhesin E family protein [Thermodesulfobacteriota bacterium]
MKSLSVKLGVIFIGLTIFGCAGMREAHWISFSSTDLYEGYYYVSKSHLLYKGTMRVWIKLEHTKKGVAEYVKEFGKDYENLSYSMQYWEFDCPGEKQRILSISQYSAEGSLIKNKSAEKSLMNTKSAKGSLTQSLGKSVSEAVCK